jgi:hypothetical protein
VSHEQYGERLESHLEDLERRLKQGRYRAQHVKRRWIPKAGSDKLRPLGIPVLEDKIVQQAVKMILEAIWEPRFYDESIGYRAGRGARQASLELRDELNDGRSRWVVEADIKGFFDHMDHGWLVIHLPGVRLLLGAVVPQCTACLCEKTNQQEEMEGQSAGTEGVDQALSQRSTAGVVRSAEAEAEGLLQLLRCDGKLLHAGETRPGSEEPLVQMAQPAKPASIHDVGRVRQTPTELGATCTEGGRKARLRTCRDL